MMDEIIGATAESHRSSYGMPLLAKVYCSLSTLQAASRWWLALTWSVGAVRVPVCVCTCVPLHVPAPVSTLHLSSLGLPEARSLSGKNKEAYTL